jgi:hypothetical protein
MTALSPSLSPSEGMKLGGEGGLFSYAELPHKRFARKPRFELGQVVATWGAMGALIDAQQDPGELLAQHVAGNWGELGPFDQEVNESGVECGFRIVSSYTLATGVQVWLVTERDKGRTTFLLSGEGTD